jgi:BASS family bile acid:Na+ symporter
MILGLDGTLAMIGSVTTTLLLPATLTPLVGWLLPEAGLSVDLAAFFARVVVLVATPFVLAWLVRRVVGVGRLARHPDLLGGANVVLLVLFAVAVMDGVTARIARDPATVATLFVASCVATAGLHAAGWALFRRAGTAAAFSAALVSGNRNMGLMLVITAGTAGETFALYVAIAQIPMYFAPLALSPFLRHSRAHTGPPT